MGIQVVGTLSRLEAWQGKVIIAIKLILFILITGLFSGTIWADGFDHSEWNTVLKKNVIVIDNGTANQVDYARIAADPSLLNHYLNALSAVTQQQFNSWNQEQQLAFLINAYNAWTVSLIVTAPSGITSIKDIGSWFTTPWKKRFIPLLGQQRSLDDIEHTLIRGSGRYNDPRIHFAVNCASIGCPSLRASAYTGDQLQLQLDDAVNKFLGDRSRNRIEDQTLKISSIFKWYGEDFAKGWLGYNSLTQFLTHYQQALGLTQQQVKELNANTIDIEFMDYDWRLNAKR